MRYFNKTNGFALEAKTGTLTEEQGLEAIKKATEALGIEASYLVVSWDKKNLTPSANGITLSHLTAEFTGKVKTFANAIAITEPVNRNLDTTIKQTKIELAGSELKANIVGYVLANAKLSIIAKGTQKNWGNIYALHCNKSENVKEALEYLTVLTNENAQNKEAKTCYTLTRFNEVYNALRSLGISEDFTNKARTIRKGEHWKAGLKKYMKKALSDLKGKEAQAFRQGVKGKLLI